MADEFDQLDLDNDPMFDTGAWCGDVPDSTVIPAGKYACEITGFKVKRTKESNKPMVVVEIELRDAGELTGQKMWQNLLLDPTLEEKPFAKVQIKKKLKSILEAIGKAGQLVSRLDPRTWVGETCFVHVRTSEYQGEKRGEIASFAPFTGAAAVTGMPAPAAAKKGAPTGAVPLPTAAPAPAKKVAPPMAAVKPAPKQAPPLPPATAPKPAPVPAPLPKAVPKKAPVPPPPAPEPESEPESAVAEPEAPADELFGSEPEPV